MPWTCLGRMAPSSEKPDHGSVGGHHSREQEASPIHKDLSVLGSDIAKPVFPVVDVDTTGKTPLRKRDLARSHPSAFPLELHVANPRA